MKENRFRFEFNPKLSFILLLYIAAGLVLVNYYKYQISPDTISYISIARKYLSGDFSNAINGYWSPFVSWLFVPFLYTKMTPLFAWTILSLIIGLFTLVGVHSLSYKFKLAENFRYAILICLVPIILKFALSDSPSDLLMVLFLVFYFSVIFDRSYSDNKWNGLLCGILGSFAYFSKSFGLPFFISHFVLFTLIHYYKNTATVKKKRILLNLFSGLITFSIISGVWIFLISHKYNQFAFSTSGNYNYKRHGPESPGHPMFYKGLIKPPNDTAISSWEDPSYQEQRSWSPLESWTFFKYQAKLISRNISETLQIFDMFSRLSRVILIFYVLLAIKPIKKLLKRGKVLYPLLSMFLFCAGYSIIHVEARYLWINSVLLIFMGAFLLNKLFQHEIFNRIRKTVLILFFISTFVMAPIRRLISNVDSDKEVYILSKKLQNEFDIQGNIAANKHHLTLYISYHIGARYYGQVKENLTDTELLNSLEVNNIDYYFAWGDSVRRSNFLDNKYKEITESEIPGLKIYSLNEKF